ncbi:MAG: DNA-processing protein DprA [Syntrophales bacterium]|nr:DNA-processing protein DprA [Syntrophales bacterium]
MEEVTYWIALKLMGSLSNGEIRSLIDNFSSPQAVFEATKEDLCRILGRNLKAVEDILCFNQWEEAKKEGEKMKAHGAKIITYLDPEFPELLKNIHDCPPFLYVKGDLKKEDINIALVGSRRASSYGIITAENLARGLALAGITIVSGLARGVDAAAHRGAIAARGRTIAVLGSGLDFVYPPENKSLFAAVAQSGALVTEYPFGTPPRAKNFPVRNRLISGMSWGVVVVEAGEKSGSLITARLAAEQGRYVFAVPGDINSPLSRGTHQLLKEGATLIEKVEDIFEEISPQIRSIKPSIVRKEELPTEANEKEALLLSLIGSRPIHGDMLIQETGLSAGDVMSILLTLELKGLITQLPGKYYQRTP